MCGAPGASVLRPGGEGVLSETSTSLRLALGGGSWEEAFFSLGVLGTKRDSVSTYSRNYKHKRERLPCSNTRGGRPKHNGPTQGGETKAMHEAGEAGQK